MAKIRALFLCTHNFAKSQIAEGQLGHLAGDHFEVVSAGTEAIYVKPETKAVLHEIGLDISGQDAKTREHYLGEPFDYVITVCD
jgi:arsenate reductase